MRLHRKEAVLDNENILVNDSNEDVPDSKTVLDSDTVQASGAILDKIRKKVYSMLL